jgi:hypothetical protein
MGQDEIVLIKVGGLHDMTVHEVDAMLSVSGQNLSAYIPVLEVPWQITR